MPGEECQPEVTTEKIERIPLFMISKTIGDQIRKNGKAVFHIEVEKTFQNSFTIIVVTGNNTRQENQKTPARPEGDGNG